MLSFILALSINAYHLKTSASCSLSESSACSTVLKETQEPWVNTTIILLFLTIIINCVPMVILILILLLKGSCASCSGPLPRCPPRERSGRELEVFRGSASNHRGSTGRRSKDCGTSDGAHLHLPRDDPGPAGVHAEARRLRQESRCRCHC